MKQARRNTGMKRRDFLKASLAGAATALSAGFGAPAIGQAPKTLRFGHMLPTTQTQSRAVAMFGDELAKLSGNKFKVEVFPSSQLGSIAEMMQSVQAGSLSMSMAVPAWYSSFAKPLDAFTLPYLVASADKLRPALDGAIGREISKYCEGAGFKVIGYWLLGGRHIVNKVRAVNKPADCQGLKLRVINSQVYMSTFRALGANPVAMDPSELYLAMQQGVVDGFEFPLPDLVAQKLYEVAKFVSLDQHTTDFFIVSTGQKFWTGLSAEEQGMINAAMKTAMDWQWKEQPVEINNALARLKTLLAVNEISPENKKLFVEATRPVYAQFEPSIGKPFLDQCIRDLG
ncbi:MAG: DctP family TRAP transporter solute-binding subunit [Casimicrobiaceae bacterium]